MLAAGGWVTPNVGTAKAADDRKMTAVENPVHKKEKGVINKKEKSTV